MTEVKREIIKEKAKLYFKNKISIHIETNSNRFYNGLIMEISDKHIVLADRVLGNMFLLFSEIEELEKFSEKIGGVK